MTDGHGMLFPGLTTSAFPFPGGERWFGCEVNTQSGSSWVVRSGMISCVEADCKFLVQVVVKFRVKEAYK